MDTKHRHVRLWKYRVAGEHVDAFIRHYSMDGTWARLFNEADGYIGTHLWRDETDTSIFYTADYWRDRQAFDGFNAQHRDRYAQLDRELESLTLEETFIGAGNMPRSGEPGK